MKHPPRVIAISLVSTGVLAAFAGPANAAPAQSPPNYWTAARMQAAKPLDLIDVGKSAVGDASKAVRGLARQIGPTSPLADNTGKQWTGGGKVKHTAGRVFFKLDGKDSSCSGDAVTSKNKSVVVTAGHCVKYQGSFHKKWIFVPGYHDGKRPYGTWTAKKLLTTPQWKKSEDLNYDVGMAVVGSRGGKKLTNAVGGQGIAFNQPRGKKTYAFGYPAETPYDGEKLIYCNGTAFNEPLGQSNDQGLNCTQTGGASGGPWFTKFSKSKGTGLQNSVNSFKYSFYPGWMFGPYFGKEAASLYRRAQTG